MFRVYLRTPANRVVRLESEDLTARGKLMEWNFFPDDAVTQDTIRVRLITLVYRDERCRDDVTQNLQRRVYICA